MGSLAVWDISIDQHCVLGKRGLALLPQLSSPCCFLVYCSVCPSSKPPALKESGAASQSLSESWHLSREQQKHSLTSPLKARLFTSYWLGRGVSVSRAWHAGARQLSQDQSAAGVEFIISAVTAAGTRCLLGKLSTGSMHCRDAQGQKSVEMGRSFP